jgi:dolichol-phosphate mannosyltransferase
MLLTIIIPAYNEECWVGELLVKIAELRLEHNLKKEILIVDDGSSDGTKFKISTFIEAYPQLDVQLLSFPENKGKGAAVRAGLLLAKGDLMIVQDADLEYNPQDINDVVLPIINGRARVVYGSRILREKALGRSGMFGLITGKHPHSYVLAYLGGVMITKMTNLLTGSRLTDEPTCYKCFHRSAIEGLTIECNDFSWEPEVTVKLLRKRIDIVEVPISYHPRKNSQGKKINWTHGVKALWTIWKFA